MRFGFYIQGRQQWRKLPNALLCEVATDNNSDPAFLVGSVWNGGVLKPRLMINWRASLVPAAAVIPAPIAYIKVAAVKKLVVGFVARPSGGAPSLGPFVWFFGRSILG